ncbi:cytochrome P450 [Actinomadura alba]|uniref:Cytochrome P450 n=1 Tax=Actinomadura alba TaxID=406431 RepID=A0ABR7LVH7_9ACTN|nr:cytochrome P450 [Actinomadura alba]MBC6468678.1 cytochrome P450 [Actinomadura alba]
MTVTAVIFDVGGVLAHPGAGQFSEEFFGSHLANGDHPWHRLERGELTLAQAMPMLDLPPGPPRPPLPYTLDEDYLELAEQLAEAGVKLALCTNTPRESAPLWQALYPWADLFDVIIRSCDIGARKPDVRLVRTALEQLGTDPRETLFVDDLPANCESARTLGVTVVDGGGPEGITRIRTLTGVAADAPRRAIGYRGPRRPPVHSRGDQLLVDVMFAPEHNDDPYPLLRELRETSPLHQLSGSPVWYATRYQDCRQVLRHPDFLKNTEYMAVDFVTGEAVPPPPASLTLPLAFIDPPEHTPVRQLMNSGFTRRRLDDWRPWLHRLATGIVGKALSEAGPIDVVEAISYPLAMQVICDLVGVPANTRNDFRSLMRDASVIFEPALPPQRTYDAITAIMTMTEYLTDLGDTEEGLLRDLLHKARAAGDVSDEDVIANITFLFFAGFETVAHLLSITMFLMATHPDQYALLTASPQLAASAAQECHRFHSPVRTNARVAGRDLDLAGTPIPAGNAVVTLLGAANRDPAAFPDPDRFDITRHGPVPLTFGTGIHYCLGAQLAPLEATVLLDSLIAAGVRQITPRQADWKHAIVLRGFDTLELDFT